MTWIHFVLIIIMFIVIDYFANLGKNKYAFMKSSILGILLILTSFLSLGLGIVIIILLDSVLPLGNSLFVTGLFIILVSAVIEFLLLHWCIKKWFYDDLILTIVEYFIQWVLVYLTLYQVLTQSFSKIQLDIDPSHLVHVLNVDIANLMILPVLLISWISIIMHKINLRA